MGILLSSLDRKSQWKTYDMKWWET